MQASMMSRHLPTLHETGPAGLVSPLAAGCRVAWPGLAWHRSLRPGKGALVLTGTSGSNQGVHCTQEEGKQVWDVSSRTLQSGCLTTALYCLEASRGRILKERCDQSHGESCQVSGVPKGNLLTVLRNGSASRATRSCEQGHCILGSVL